MHSISRLNPVISAILFITLTTLLPAGCGKEAPDESESILPTDEMSQKAALMKFYEATKGDRWMNNLNWGSDRPLQEWFGIRTTDGHVTEINLQGNHLDGYLPDELFELVYLENLVLDSPKHHNTLDDENKDDWNLIYGDLNELGPKIAQLTNLKQLNFNGLVKMTCGDIPDEIWMPQIENIDISQLPIKGCISPAIGNATNLRQLRIDRNNAKTDLRGTIPTEITKLKKLENLDLSGNRHLTGPIPDDLGNLKSLQILRLGACALTGTIPESIFKLEELYGFNVSDNFLEGGFDLSRLSLFPNLDYCSIGSNNYLQGIGAIPDNIRSISFDKDGTTYHYGFGELKWSHEAYYNTSEMLKERLAEE